MNFKRSAKVIHLEMHTTFSAKFSIKNKLLIYKVLSINLADKCP
ncbi:MAG: hypothetical protein PWR20_2010 [Bacteroidales bacterium]|jgi:hypothetical protein|nr:hypothetical protein [Bacteroidales bacterium]MDN5329616.1 hypothetical protein [Bacteroidales bacterium]